jgi:hypothetical protein
MPDGVTPSVSLQPFSQQQQNNAYANAFGWVAGHPANVTDQSLIRKMVIASYANHASDTTHQSFVPIPGATYNGTPSTWSVLLDTDQIRASGVSSDINNAGNYDAVAYYNNVTHEIVVVNLGANDGGETFRGAPSAPACLNAGSTWPMTARRGWTFSTNAESSPRPRRRSSSCSTSTCPVWMARASWRE